VAVVDENALVLAGRAQASPQHLHVGVEQIEKPAVVRGELRFVLDIAPRAAVGQDRDGPLAFGEPHLVGVGGPLDTPGGETQYVEHELRPRSTKFPHERRPRYVRLGCVEHDPAILWR